MLRRSQEQPNPAPYSTSPAGRVNYPDLHQGRWKVMPACWQLNIMDIMQGNGAGYLSVTGNMQKAKPCTLSIFNFRSAFVSALPNVFPLRVKKMLSCSNPLGRRRAPPLQSHPASSQGAHATPNPTEPTALQGHSPSRGASCFPAAGPPR